MGRRLATLVAGTLLLGACGGETTTTETTTTTTASTTTTSDNTTTTETTSTTAGSSLRLVITGDPELAGVAFGTDSDSAVTALIEVFGEPTDDDAEVRCPYFGDTDNMRWLSWGSLTAIFTSGYPGNSMTGLVGFRYKLDEVGAAYEGGPDPRNVTLPDSVNFGDTMSDIIGSLGGEIMPTEIGIDFVTINGYALESTNLDPDMVDPSAPIDGIIVGRGFLDCD